jgi:NAD(P)H-nitrite reductase large subunit
MSVLAGKQTVTSVDAANKTVTLEDGKETTSYDALVLASGSVPRRLPIEGGDLENVYTLRDVQDAKKIDAGKSLRYAGVA